jgi:hypothetical protein
MIDRLRPLVKSNKFIRPAGIA